MKNKILSFAFKCDTSIYYMITSRYFVLQPAAPPPPPPPFSLGDGGLNHFSEHLHRRDVGQIGIFFGNCHFWSPTITNLWQSVFVLLFSMVYAPPYPQIYFYVCGAKFFVCVLQVGAGNISNFLGTFFIMEGVLISFLGEGAQVTHDQSFKFKNS